MKKLSFVFLALIMMFTALPNQSHANTATADEIITNAKKHIGTPYLWGGTTPKAFDCSGFARYVFGQSDISLPRTTSSQYNYGKSVSKSDLEKGDIVFFNTSGKGVSHSGIYVGNNEFIHASTSRGIMISDINDPYYWGSKYIGARRVFEEEKVEVIASGEKLKALPKAQYHDVNESHWAYVPIKELSLSDIVFGLENSQFLPSEGVTRGEVAKMLQSALELEDANIDGLNYGDVSHDTKYADAIASVSQSNLMTGFENDQFRPDSVLTREQVAAILVRAFNIGSGNDHSIDFNDVNEDRWSYGVIQYLASSGLVSGYDDGTFRPANNLTRAEITSLLYRSLN